MKRKLGYHTEAALGILALFVVAIVLLAVAATL